MRKFNHWAYLNKEGKELFGSVFLDGIVPVLSMIPMYGSLGQPDAPPQSYFLVYMEELTEEQIERILDKLIEKFNAPRDDVRKELREHGLPLRQSLTNGSGTNHLGLFV